MRYFKPDEFSCKCGCGKGYPDMDNAMLELLDELRHRCGFPFRLTSAFRCEPHNDEINGSPNSMHLQGCAVDIFCDGSEKRMSIVSNAIELGFRGIGIAKSFVHVDTRSDKPRVLWLY